MKGASAGIGQATAVEFAKHGASLALMGRNKERLDVTIKQCLDTGMEKEKVCQIC